MLIGYKRGQTGVILRVKLLDSAATTGAGKTGLTSSSAGLLISTIADNEATPTVYAQASSNVETITTLGTFATPTSSKCRFKEVDATNHKGVYEIQIDNTRYAVSSAKSLLVSLSGVTGMAETDVVIPLRDLDPYDAVRGGLTSLPNAAAEASGGLATLSAAQASNGTINVNVHRWLTGTPNALQTGRVDGYLGATAAGAITSASFSADTGLVPSRTGTAQAGAATTITLDASASATTDFYKGCFIALTGSTGSGQSRLCTAYNGTTKVATVTPAWATNPGATSTFAVIPGGSVDVQTLNFTTQTARDIGASVLLSSGTGTGQVTLTSGRVNADLTHIAATAWASTTLFTLASHDPGATLSSLTQANIRTAVGLASANLDTQLSAIAGYIDTEIASLTSELAKVPKSDSNVTFNSTALSSIQSSVNSALVAIGLDHLISASVTGTDITDNSIIAKLVSKSATADWDTFNNTTDALESLRDRGDAAWITATGFSTHTAADVWLVGTRLLTAGTNIVLAKGTGVTGFNDLDAAGIRSATGLGSANLDTQLNDIYNSVGTVLTYVDTEIADISSRLPASLSVNNNMKVDVEYYWDTGTVSHERMPTNFYSNVSQTGNSYALVNHSTFGLNALSDRIPAVLAPSGYMASTIFTMDSALIQDIATAAAEYTWDWAERTLTALDEDTTTIDLDATIRAAVGLSSANLDTQLSNISNTVNGISANVDTEIAALQSSIDSLLTTAVTQSYRAKGAAPSVSQALCELLSHLGEVSFSGLTKTLYKFDGTTPAMTFAINTTPPTSISRAT